MTIQRDRAAQLRAFYTDGTLVLPNAWDAASARLVERAGAQAIGTTSAGVSWSLGRPDGQAITRTEQTDVIRRIVDVVQIPVTADIEGGYGATPAEVALTVAEIIGAGAVGINLEDSRGDGTLFTAEEQSARIAEARRAATAAGLPELVINARTDPFLLGIGKPEDRLGDVLARGQAYAKAGADGLFVPGLHDLEVIRELAARSPLPVNIMVNAAAPTVAELTEAGVRRVSVGASLAEVAYAVVERAAKEIVTLGTYKTIEPGGLFGGINSAFSRG